MKTMLSMLAACAALFLLTANAIAEDKHEGKVVSVSNGKLVMTDMDGKNEHSHQVPKEAVVTLDGKTVMLDDLTKDCYVTVTTEKRGDASVVTKVEASKTKPKK